MPALLLDLTIKSTLLLAAAFAITWTLRKSAAATRHLVWSLTFVALLALPLLSRTLPAWQILPAWSTPYAALPSAAPEIPTPEQLPLPPAAQANVRATSKPPSPNHPMASSQTPPAPSSPIQHSEFRIQNFLLLFYIFGLALSLLPLLAATRALRYLERRSTPLLQTPWQHLLAAAMQALATGRPITLLQGDQLATMPMAWGLIRARIILPRDADTWSSVRRRIVLLHELAHLKRHDPLTQFLARLTCSLYWFHPLAWLAARQLRIEAERACDDLVLTAAIKPSTYAAELLAITTSHRPASFSIAALAMARANNHQLHARIHAILDTARERKAMSRATIFLFATLLIACSVPLAMIRATDIPTPQSAPKEFPHLVHFALGESKFLPGDNITITEIRGTADTITPNSTYQIKGTYTLASAEEASLATYVTSPIPNDLHHDPYDPRQTVSIKKGAGTFTVVLPFLSIGYPHLSFYPRDGGSSFSTLYFGTGDSLYKTDNPKRVLILVSPAGISFEDQPTTWEALPVLLEKIPDRPNTILAFAFTSDQMTIADYHTALAHTSELGKQFHFKYTSDAGIKSKHDVPPATAPHAQSPWPSIPR